MRYVGYFLLLFLFLYFSLLKPYMIIRGIRIDVKGFYIDTKNRKVGADNLLLFIPDLKENSLFVDVLSVSLSPKGIYAGSVSVVEVTKKVSKEPFDYDFTQLIKLAQKLNLHVGSVYVSLNTPPEERSITVFIKGIKLVSGIVTSNAWSRTVYMKGNSRHELYIFLKKAHAKADIFYVDEAIVTSDLYTFYGSGEWKGKEGKFQAKGIIKGYENTDFKLPYLHMIAKGRLNYTSLNVIFSAKADSLEVRGNNMGKLSGEGKLYYIFGNTEKLTANLSVGSMFVNLDYRMYPEDILYANFRGLSVDNKLFKSETPFSLKLSGSATLLFKKRELSLKGFSDSAFFLDRNFKNVNIELSYNYQNQTGKLDFSADDPATINLSGTFTKGNFEGDVYVYMLEYTYDDFSTYLNYMGSIRYMKGILYTSGSGKLVKPVYNNVSLGDISFDLDLRDENYSIAFSGTGFGGDGKGSIRDRSFSGRILFKGYSTQYAGVLANNIVGELSIKVSPLETRVNGGVEGKVSKEGVTARIMANADLIKRVEWQGSFFVRLEDLKKDDFYLSYADVKASIEKGLLIANYSSEYAKGKIEYSFVDGTFFSTGNLKLEREGISLKGSYQLQGKGENFSAQLTGQGGYLNYNFPIKAFFQNTQQGLKGVLRGFSLKMGIFQVSLQDSYLEGSKDKGTLKIGEISISVNSERVLKVQSSQGQWDIKKGILIIPGIFASGSLIGKAEVYYRSGEFSITSQGILDLGQVMGLVKSKVFTYAEGELSYTFEKSGKILRLRIFSPKDIELRSRFLALPLKGRVYALYDGKVWEGSVNFKGDDADFKAHITGDEKLIGVRFSTQRLPVLFRSESVRFNGFAKADGSITTDYKRMNIRASVDLGGNMSIKSLGGKVSEKPKAYKFITLNVKLSTSEPLRISLPEGYIYTYAEGEITGSLYEPKYNIKLGLMGGSLEYFNKEFHVREGTVLLTSEKTNLDVTMLTTTPDYSIIVDIKGNANNPKAFVRSEPPTDTRQVLTSLVLGGGTGEGLFSLSSALIAQFPELSRLIEGVERAVGTDVKVNLSPTVSSGGGAAVNTRVSKDFTNKLNVEYQQSTSKDPKETYGGANVKITPNTSVGVRIYSNNSQEYKVRFRKKFDF